MKKIVSFCLALCATTALWAGSFTQAAFSIADGKYIYFSQGNLQCTLSATDTTWLFAENQYDIIGWGNTIGPSLAEKIDLFGWSGSTGSAKWGVSISTNPLDYAGDFADWGANTIGTSAPNTYRTLTKDEWTYLLETRTNASEKQGVAHINITEDGAQAANGLILLPDNWVCPDGIAFTNDGTDYSANTFTLAEWQKLEAAGAVFLPAAGNRMYVGMDGVQSTGSYWTATPLTTNYPYYMAFGTDTKANANAANTCILGVAVRLVQDLHVVSIAAAENGTVAIDKLGAIEGETVTLTVTPASHCVLKSISVMQGETEIELTPVAGASNQYTFTMPAGDVAVNAEFEKVASAFTSAAFSIADGKQIAFSQGNLQCMLSATDTTWAFAEYQTEMIGVANKNGDALTEKIDLFGWSGSTGSAKWGISTSKTPSDYAGDFVDWGTNIGDGDTYRTLTKDEWDYLVNTRTNASELRGIARINLNSDGTQYANGLILLPDNWTGPADVEFKSGFADNYGIEDYATYQTFTLAQWQKLEAAGAIFLSAAGGRDGSVVYNVQANSYYWSATPNESEEAYELYGFSAGLNPSYNERRYFGFAVRLVQEIYAVTVTTPENGTVVANKSAATEGETITLTITSAEGYEVESVTVTYGDGQTVEVKDNKFVMPAGDVMVSATFKKIVYTITIADDIKNGVLTADKTTAAEGETVTLTVAPAEGYEVESVTVTYGDGQTVEVSAENTFVMPAGAVTITVVFKESGTAIGTVEMLDLRTENGSIIYDGEFQIFDLLGRNVTRLNGSLNGVYIVKVGDKAQKVVVSSK